MSCLDKVKQHVLPPHKSVTFDIFQLEVKYLEMCDGIYMSLGGRWSVGCDSDQILLGKGPKIKGIAYMFVVLVISVHEGVTRR